MKNSTSGLFGWSVNILFQLSTLSSVEITVAPGGTLTVAGTLPKWDVQAEIHLS